MPRPSTQRTTIMWFRDDLRITDNPALSAASVTNTPVVALYLLDDESPGLRPLGGAARWWLHHSLNHLTKSLEKIGCRLVLRRGAAEKAVPEIVQEIRATSVFWNRRYGDAATVDARIEQTLTSSGVHVESHKASLLFEPDEVKSRAGNPMQVYSAFWRAARNNGEPRPPLAAPLAVYPCDVQTGSETLEAFRLLPSTPDWATGLRATCRPGEAAAMERLESFVGEKLTGYANERDIPAIDGTSAMSPHLRFGEISPFQIWHKASGRDHGSAKFLAEIGWREFAYHLLGQFPMMAEQNLKPAFDRFPWQTPPPEILKSWQTGHTGYPIVDAGMRQLWSTGLMHNRVRMVVASFLTKHLLVDWRVGEQWFWDTLVDADPASNPSNWQWVAGSGADAQPYFRIFNPILQGEKFDARGAYVREFVPEIAKLPDRFIHKPWKASPIELAAAGVELGKTYPRPIVEHGLARARALDAYKDMKQAEPDTCS